uniref:Uncharacterized protein MANES_11G086600 n=1 Tax=Rhizophora mucronata TaxID=61149 RepID=A0A2P2LLR6_RHIMU
MDIINLSPLKTLCDNPRTDFFRHARLSAFLCSGGLRHHLLAARSPRDGAIIKLQTWPIIIIAIPTG